MATFEWDERKNQENQDKHGISFERAQYAFADPDRLILRDKRHSIRDEDRYFCVGRISGGIVTVRFVRRGAKIRIFGAGFWRNYRHLYLERNR
ncbi:MAG: BrnT family toxin [Caldilineaceae bacterium]